MMSKVNSVSSLDDSAPDPAAPFPSLRSGASHSTLLCPQALGVSHVTLAARPPITHFPEVSKCSFCMHSGSPRVSVLLPSPASSTPGLLSRGTYFTKGCWSSPPRATPQIVLELSLSTAGLIVPEPQIVPCHPQMDLLSFCQCLIHWQLAWANTYRTPNSVSHMPFMGAQKMHFRLLSPRLPKPSRGDLESVTDSNCEWD